MPRNEGFIQHCPESPPTTATIRYQLNERGYVSLVIYSLTGKHIKTLVNTVLEPGTYNLNWDGRNERGQDVNSGVYLYKMLFNGTVTTRNLLLIQ